MLAEHGASIAEVSLMLGFANQSHFTRVFHKMTGTTPKRFRENSARTVLQSRAWTQLLETRRTN